MTVEELIAKLKELDPDAVVMQGDGEFFKIKEEIVQQSVFSSNNPKAFYPDREKTSDMEILAVILDSDLSNE